MKNTIMQVQNIDFAYGQTKILKNISFEIPQGQFISIIGPNGSGKSTILKIMSGILTANHGQVTYKNNKLNDISIRDRAKEIAVIHQREKNEFPFSCMETIIMGLHPHRNRFEPVTSENLTFINEIMHLTDTYHFANKLTTEISSGELQRVNLAKALVQKPKLLLMDEAMSDMDVNARIQLTKILKKQIKDVGLTVIEINHDLNMAYQFSDKIIALKEGIVDLQGIPSKVMDTDFFKRVFRVNVQIIGEHGFFILDNI
ncbi:MAG: ABC transporter ATP-binding protein [Sedimentibacter sp.]